MTNLTKFKAILFDLDGTLVDTAPDMVTILRTIQEDEGYDPLPYCVARSHVSNGCAGLVNLAFPHVTQDKKEELQHKFLKHYEESVCVHSVLFPGLGLLLDKLDTKHVPWGIVTNKPTRITEPLLAALGISTRTTCTICGDTLGTRKPDPAPLLLASSEIGVAPKDSVYIGDSARDIEAGFNAGMYTIAVSYGYITKDDDPETWNADQVVDDSKRLARILLDGV